MATFDLVLSSGGLKGIAFAGAVDVLERKRHRIGRVVGTSAGALTAALLAAGYTAKDLLRLAAIEGTKERAFTGFLAPPPWETVRTAVLDPQSETRRAFRKAVEAAIDQILHAITEQAPRAALLLSAGLGAIGKGKIYDLAFNALFEKHDAASILGPLLSFVEFGGFYSTDVFTGRLSEWIREKIPPFTADWSLARFFRATQCDLTVVAADTTEKLALLLNHRTAPDCPVIQAVRMSMSIPLVWQEVPWLAEWGRYQGRALTGHIIVDGGAMLNLPMSYVAMPEEAVVKQVMGQGPPGHLPLGLLLDDRLPVPGDQAPPDPDPSKMIRRLGRLIDTVTRWEDDYLRPFEANICRIPTNGYGALEFALTAERVQTLINGARDAVLRHLTKRGL